VRFGDDALNARPDAGVCGHDACRVGTRIRTAVKRSGVDHDLDGVVEQVIPGVEVALVERAEVAFDERAQRRHGAKSTPGRLLAGLRRVPGLSAAVRSRL